MAFWDLTFTVMGKVTGNNLSFILDTFDSLKDVAIAKIYSLVLNLDVDSFHSI